MIRFTARSNYTVVFPEATPIGQRVLWLRG